MLNSYTLLEAMNGIHEKQITMALDFLGYGNEEQPRRHHSVWRTVLIAAALSLLLASVAYAIYLATMAHRELRPEDENSYYFNGEEGSGNEGIHLNLNFGDCAVALHFDTEERGAAHVFRWKNESFSDLQWTQTASLYDFFKNLSYDPDYFLWPSCTIEEALQQSGLTEEEAKTVNVGGRFVGRNGTDRQHLNVSLLDGPQLFESDQILGWPKGTAEIIREDTWGGYQRLEIVITREFGEGGREIDKHLFLFHPEEQYLLSISAPDEMVTFDEMEAIAEEIEVIETGFSYSLKKGVMNWAVADYGAG